MDPTELAAGLATFLDRHGGMPGVTIEHLHRLAGGASRETWAFDAAPGNGRGDVRRLVLRLDPGPTSMQSDRGQEFRVLRAVHAAGIPVPAPLCLGEDPTILGGRFLVMERVEGETLARRLLRDAAYAGARRVITEQLGALLAGIHGVDMTQAALASLPRPAPGRPPAATELERYEQLYRALAPEPHPVIELALRWLATRVPVTPRLTLVHGDYRIGNFVCGPEGIRSVLDWELAHVGDPMEDLGWMCVKAWRYGSPLPVGGVGERDAFFAAYEAAGGGPVDPGAVHFWEVFGNMKWAVICLGQARTYLDGGVPSLELASLGRRTAEVEHELLALVG